ncbi:nicotinate-nucleotide adenylyltransferase [Neisseriaceae bacterium JH1-16]|nr:nicotinate-nucleotide adenylyltransferase [Neisseriaceae bacterium JH1-16]
MSVGLGLFGGTFDPIHAAHLRLARALRDELDLAEVRLTPAGDPYHRSEQPGANAAHRLAMVEAAIAGEPRLTVDDREVRRQRPAYTVETLEELRAELGPTEPLWLLIGGDSLATLDSWWRWEDLFGLANLAVALRPGFSVDALPAAVARHWQVRQVTDFPNQAASGTIRALTLPPVDVSATAIRARLQAGGPADGLVPDAVLAYIARHGLYR